MFWDSTYILVLIGAVICAIASFNVNRTYNKFSKMNNVRGLTAEEVAERMLHNAGVYDVTIERIRGNLTDHYSPSEKVLRLSDGVYGSTSVAALGIAAHEAGHALQHHQGYGPLKLRSLSVPLANIGSKLSWPMILLGLVFGWIGLAQAGVVFFGFLVLFQLITLPVEFNASNRAIRVLRDQNILIGEEIDGAGKVLKAAALTYVAALFSAILQLLRLVILVRGSDRKR